MSSLFFPSLSAASAFFSSSPLSRRASFVSVDNSNRSSTFQIQDPLLTFNTNFWRIVTSPIWFLLSLKFISDTRKFGPGVTFKFFLQMTKIFWVFQPVFAFSSISSTFSSSRCLKCPWHLFSPIKPMFSANLNFLQGAC